MKLLLVLLTVLAVVWLLRGARQSTKRRDLPPAAGDDRPRTPGAAVQTMVRCAHCGMHLPAADAIRHAQLPYCSAAHRKAGPRPPFDRP